MEPLLPELAMAVIFTSFVSAVLAAIATSFFMILLQRMNDMWKRRTGNQIPRNIAKRGIALAIGPAFYTVVCALKIFLIITTGTDLSVWWNLLFMILIGFYCVGISAFIFSIFEELYKVQDIEIDKLKGRRKLP